MTQLFTIFSISALITLPLCIIIKTLIINYFNLPPINVVSITQIFIKVSFLWSLVFILLLFLMFSNIMNVLRKKSIIDNLKNDYDRILIKNKNLYQKHILTKNSFSLVFMLILTVLSIFISGYIYSELTLHDNDSMDYIAYSKEVIETEVYNNYILESNPDSFIPTEQFNIINNMNDVEFIDAYPYLKSYSILMYKNDNIPYFKEWSKMYGIHNTNYDKSILKSNFPTTAKQYISIQNINFIIANESMLDNIIEHYGLDTNINTFTNNKEMMLFLPDISDADKYNIINRNMSIGGIYKHNNSLDFESDTFRVSNVIDEKYNITYNNYIQKREGITVLISSAMAEMSNIFDGFQRLEISANEAANFGALDNKIFNELSNIQGSLIFSNHKETQKYNIFLKYIPKYIK